MNKCWDKLYYNAQLSNGIWLGTRPKILTGKLSKKEALNHLKFIDCCLSNPFKTKRWFKVWDDNSSLNAKVHWDLILYKRKNNIRKFLCTDLDLYKWSELGAECYVETIRHFFNTRGERLIYDLLLPRSFLEAYPVRNRKYFQLLNKSKANFTGKLEISLHNDIVAISIYGNDENFNIVDLMWLLVSSREYPYYISSEILNCSSVSYILIKNLPRFLDIKRRPAGKLRFTLDNILSYIGSKHNKNTRIYLKQCLKSDLPLLFPGKSFKIKTRKKKSLVIEWQQYNE